jgi:hypothetical protein
MPNTMDPTTLQMALIGYEAERQKIQQKIADLRAQLNGRSRRASASATAAPATRTRRRMSAVARKRIAAAQKKRWAEYHKKQKAA